jgi:4-hydroxythreonine-4-phosphate dehydrogenase
MEKYSIKVGITHGDINGIGYEVILKALEDPAIFDLCTPVVYGSAKIAGFYRRTLGMQPLQHTVIDSATDARRGTINVINVVPEELRIEPGQCTPEAGNAAFAALERAVADLQAGAIDVLVTAPINKSNIQSPTFQFPGHTEYLEASLGNGGEHHALMILCHESLRVALVTTHLPIAEVSEHLTVDTVSRKIVEFNAALIRDFAVHCPRIAVLSLNPHSGDQGLLGTEEKEVIEPAIKMAQELGVQAFGPYAADGLFGSGNYSKFDGVLAMYHDQGLAPFKALSQGNGVNFTAGLPFVRTSPDHGTAFDIAGTGAADAQSMRNAIYTAMDAFRHRANHAEAFANPLKKLYETRGRDNVVLNLDKD